MKMTLSEYATKYKALIGVVIAVALIFLSPTVLSVYNLGLRGWCRFVGLVVDSITTNHATRPSSRRRSMMLMPNSVLIRLSRYQTMYSSSMPTNLSIETPVKLRLWKNSCLSRPKKPLRGRVVRRTAFRAHRTRQVVVHADADPFRPPVVAAAVGIKPMSV